jgi:hypothetical protein
VRDGDRGMRGSMTLREVAAAEGVEATAVLRALGLPTDSPVDQPLGPWLRERGLAMRDVRAAVAAVRRGRS